MGQNGYPLDKRRFYFLVSFKSGYPLGPPVVPFYPLFGEGSPTKKRLQKTEKDRVPLFETLHWRTSPHFGVTNFLDAKWPLKGQLPEPNRTPPETKNHFILSRCSPYVIFIRREALTLDRCAPCGPTCSPTPLPVPMTRVATPAVLDVLRATWSDRRLKT